MAIVYRTSGPWGPGIAEDLSAEQVDGNFHGLDLRVTELEDNPPDAVSIANVTSTGSTFTVHLSDGSAIGPLLLPVAAFNARGELGCRPHSILGTTSSSMTMQPMS